MFVGCNFTLLNWGLGDGSNGLNIKTSSHEICLQNVKKALIPYMYSYRVTAHQSYCVDLIKVR